MRPSQSAIGLSLLALLGLAFLALGVLAGMGQGTRTLREARTVQALPELDAPAVQRLALDTPVVVTGLLDAHTEVADDQGLIIYLEQRWAVAYNEDEGWEGTWETVETMVPACTLALTGGHVVLHEAHAVAIDGTLHENRVFVPEQARQVQGVAEGTLRHIGFQAGEQITVVGRTTAAGIMPSRVWGGDRTTLIQHLTGRVWGLRLAGILLGLVGLGLIVTAVAMRPRRKQAGGEGR